MSPLVIVALAAGTAFTVSLRWWERNPEAGRGGEPWLAGALVLSLLLTDLALQALIGGRPVGFLGIASLGLLLAPWTLARTLAIPAGAWRSAAALGRLSGWAWRGDVRRASWVAAAAALAERPDPAGARWLRSQIAGDVTAPAVVVRAALASARGDGSRAHWLGEIALDFAESELPHGGRAIARSIIDRHTPAQRGTIAPRDAFRPLAALASAWESTTSNASGETRQLLTAALEELAAQSDVPVAELSAAAPSLVGYRSDDRWSVRFDDLERRLDRNGILDPEAELHRWLRLRADLEGDASSRGARHIDARVWMRGERLLQRFAVRLHETPEGAPLAISVLRWVRSRAWAMGDVQAADVAHSNLALARA